jgi:hypothetical protein
MIEDTLQAAEEPADVEALPLEDGPGEVEAPPLEDGPFEVEVLPLEDGAVEDAAGEGAVVPCNFVVAGWLGVEYGCLGGRPRGAEHGFA